MVEIIDHICLNQWILYCAPVIDTNIKACIHVKATIQFRKMQSTESEPQFCVQIMFEKTHPTISKTLILYSSYYNDKCSNDIAKDIFIIIIITIVYVSAMCDEAHTNWWQHGIWNKMIRLICFTICCMFSSHDKTRYFIELGFLVRPLLIIIKFQTFLFFKESKQTS